MFQKVLIVENTDYTIVGMKSELSKLGIYQIDTVQSCDCALLKLKKSEIDNEPYDLLICDLILCKDPECKKISNYHEIIKNTKKSFPSIKIIIFSNEFKPLKVEKLFKEKKINGYVYKSRYGLKELKGAIQKIYFSDDNYISQEYSNAITKGVAIELDDFEIYILKSLSNGFSQEQISAILKENEYYPSSISSIEKRIKNLRDCFNANNPTHLVSIVKDLGLV